MKLYHYISKPNRALEQGILSFAKNADADISYYVKRSGCDNKAGIISWMESCFTGRSRAIRALSEPIKYTHQSIDMFKSFIESSDIYSIDIEDLDKDGFIEDIYISPARKISDKTPLQFGTDEELKKLTSTRDIDYSSIDWSKCDDSRGLRFSVIPYYLLIIKGGIILPKYIKKE